MEVTIRMDGYVLSPHAPLLIESGTRNGPNGGLGDAQHPVIYQAWKLGPDPGLDRHKHQFKVVPDGRFYTIDLFKGLIEEGKVVGSLRVAVARAEPRKFNVPYDWSVSIDVPEGGIVEANEPFLFLAPHAGYQHTYSLLEKVGDPRWGVNVDRGLYLRLGSPPVYIALKAEFSSDFAGEALVDFEYWINPSGSRNLQHHP